MAALGDGAVCSWITPMVLDGVAQGDPDRAGVGYAINIAGCVFGPLVSGFVLLPLLGERYTLLACAVPWLVVSLRTRSATALLSVERQAPSMWKPALVSFIALVLVAVTNDYETRYSPREVRRDNTATVTAVGSGMEKQLLVNGIGMTGLTPITKMIAHLPLAFLQTPAKRSGHLFWNGHYSPLHALMGNFFHRRRARAQRGLRLSLLPR